jgi:Predicted redox protein, regulator of disulfide bond formation
MVLPKDTYVDAEVDLGVTGEAYLLQARLFVSIPGVDRETANQLVEIAHQTCPYSKATKGNINISTTII